MAKQHQKLLDDLAQSFQIPVFVDEIAPDERPTDNHYFLIVYGDMNGSNEGQMYQEVFVVYITEKNPAVEENTVDIISTVSKLPGFSFDRTVKERFRQDETENYIDQVTIIFQRLLKYEY